ncbi:ABC1 kinase family protein [Stenoxybacter acetivorans]|uniref:ABC1 kinase family protein n=1 Tax=Stenoxybacter acetivorans TaxID=422441 RepID=UPI000568EFA2|nr:AarF/UbiB family protein [Stenoxybacter acetivorans]
MKKSALSALGDLSRLREITAVLTKHGLGEFASRIKLPTPFRRNHQSEADSGRIRRHSLPQRTAMALEDLGPAFIKLGQLLSTRTDIFDAEWTDAFAKLQDNARELPADSIRQLIQQELTQNIDDVFEYIDPQPLGSASIAQVHFARLHGGNNTALKIKRPNIDATIAADLRILTHIATLIETEIPETRRYRPVQMVHYFARSLTKETDLSNELHYIQYFARIYRDTPHLHIPSVYPEYSTQKLLAQEFIDGTLLSRVRPDDLPPATRRQLAENITDCLLNMILQQGIFHADPHPGNIFFNSANNITLVDFGLIGQLSQTRRREIIALIYALMRRDGNAMQFVLSNWAQGEIPDEDLLGMDLMEMLSNYEHVPMRHLRISQVIGDITRILRTHELTLPAELVMLFKTLMTLDGVLKQLDGDFELLTHTKPIIKKLIRQRISPQEIWQKSQANARMLAFIAGDIPHNLLRFGQRLQKGRFGINLDIKRLEELNNRLDHITNRLTMGIVTAALIIGSSIVMNINAGPKMFGLPFFGFIGYLLAFGNSLWLLWSIWRSGKH